MKIGLIGLDTSHAASFCRRLNAMEGVKVNAVVDRGDGSSQRLAEFSREFDAAVCPDVAALAGCCDAAMVLSKDWRTHLADLEILIAKRIPCYCDKPLCDSPEEAGRLLAALEATETLFFAGSGWRWCRPTRAIYETCCEQRIDGVMLTCQNDLDYYGIHAVEWLLGLLGPGIESVECLGGKAPRAFRLAHRRCGEVILLLETTPTLGRRGWLSANGETRFLELTLAEIHDGICDNFVAMVRSGILIAPYCDYVESVVTMAALRKSIANGQKIRVEAVKFFPFINFPTRKDQVS